MHLAQSPAHSIQEMKGLITITIIKFIAIQLMLGIQR